MKAELKWDDEHLYLGAIAVGFYSINGRWKNNITLTTWRERSADEAKAACEASVRQPTKEKENE
jgi:hypothetical protein